MCNLCSIDSATLDGNFLFLGLGLTLVLSIVASIFGHRKISRMESQYCDVEKGYSAKFRKSGQVDNLKVEIEKRKNGRKMLKGAF